MNLLLLEAGDTHVAQSHYPDFLTELPDGSTPLQQALDRASRLRLNSLSIAFRKSDISSANVDRVAKLLVRQANIIEVQAATGGAACSALLATPFIASDLPLLIVSGNEVVEYDFEELIEGFAKRGLDGGLLTFDSVHPRYAFAQLDENNLVQEVAEKRPISRNALAGLYYFARGQDFVWAAQRMIRKGATVNGSFYVSPTYNEMILQGARVGVIEIESERYIPLKSEEQLYRVRGV